MTKRTHSFLLALLCAFALVLTACGQSTDAFVDEASEQEAAEQEVTQAIVDGTYDIEVDTDSSMFRCEECTLTVEGDTYTAALSLPGEGFSRLYFGSAEDAASASDDLIYDYYVNDDGLYTFDIPVETLDEDLPIAAFGQRRDTWYDHTINFHVPDEA